MTEGLGIGKISISTINKLTYLLKHHIIIQFTFELLDRFNFSNILAFKKYSKFMLTCHSKKSQRFFENATLLKKLFIKKECIQFCRSEKHTGFGGQRSIRIIFSPFFNRFCVRAVPTNPQPPVTKIAMI